MPTTAPDDTAELFTVAEAGGKISIHNVPIFRCHEDRNYDCDEVWLDRCIADFYAQKAESIRQPGADERFAMCPPITLGHTSDNPNDPEPPAIGYVDGLRRVGDTLYGDFCGIHPEDFKTIQRNRYPYRSAEIIPNRHRLTNVSLLGGRYPHFALPVMRFTAMVDGEPAEIVRFSLRGSIMPSNTQNPQRHAFGNDGGAQGGNTGGGNTVSGQINIDELVQKVAAALSAQQGGAQANANGGPNAAAYAGRGQRARYEQAKEPAVAGGQEDEEKPGKTEAHEEGGQEQGGESASKAGKHRTGDRVDRHGPKGAAKRAMWAQVTDAGDSEHRDEEGGYEDMDDEWHTRQAADTAGTKKYVAKLEATVKDLSGKLDTLIQHRADEQVATKRALLKQKFQTLVASGHAIGNEDVVNRHIDRCMKFSTDEISAYIGDLKDNSPKVKVGQRYSTDGEVVRDPSGVSRFAGIEKEQAEKYGLNEDVVKLSELLDTM